MYEVWQKGQVAQGLEEDGKRQWVGKAEQRGRLPGIQLYHLLGNRQNHHSKLPAQGTSPSPQETQSKGTRFWTWLGQVFWVIFLESYT